MGLIDRSSCPTLEEFGAYIRNPVFMQFCTEMKERYQCSEKIEYSSCSWEMGWNIKFKKSWKNLMHNISKRRIFYNYGCRRSEGKGLC